MLYFVRLMGKMSIYLKLNQQHKCKGKNLDLLLYFVCENKCFVLYGVIWQNKKLQKKREQNETCTMSEMDAFKILVFVLIRLLVLI